MPPTTTERLSESTALDPDGIAAMTNPSSPQLRAFGALALAGLIWGSSDVASKVALGAVPPITLAVLRICLALLICWPLARRRPVSPLQSTRLPLLGLIG